MKINNKKLRQIILEEYRQIVAESDDDENLDEDEDEKEEPDADEGLLAKAMEYCHTERPGSLVSESEQQRRLRRIAEQLEEEVEAPFEVEAVEDAWSGGDNLELPLDIPKVAHGADAVCAEPETLSLTELRRLISSEVKRMNKG